MHSMTPHYKVLDDLAGYEFTRLYEPVTNRLVLFFLCFYVRIFVGSYTERGWGRRTLTPFRLPFRLGANTWHQQMHLKNMGVKQELKSLFLPLKLKDSNTGNELLLLRELYIYIYIYMSKWKGRKRNYVKHAWQCMKNRNICIRYVKKVVSFFTANLLSAMSNTIP